MQLNKIQDPRDALSKARKIQISRYAAANGIADIKPEMPAELMRQILRGKGITNIGAQVQPLGGAQVETGNAEQSAGVEVNATADLAKQWAAQQGPVAEEVAAEVETPEKPQKPKVYNEMNDLRAQCKARGIKCARTDKVADLRKKLDGEDAA